MLWRCRGWRRCGSLCLTAAMRVRLPMLDAVVEPTTLADTLHQLLLFAFAIVATVSKHRLLDWLSTSACNVPLHFGVCVLARLDWYRFLAQWAHRHRTAFFVLLGAVVRVVTGAFGAEGVEAAIAPAWQEVQAPALGAVVPQVRVHHVAVGRIAHTVRPTRSGGRSDLPPHHSPLALPAPGDPIFVRRRVSAVHLPEKNVYTRPLTVQLSPPSETHHPAAMLSPSRCCRLLGPPC